MKTINKSRHIQVIETVPIYHKSALSIVQVGKKYYVLSVSEHSISKISELTSEEIKEIQQAQEIKWKTNQLTNWAEKIKGITK